MKNKNYKSRGNKVYVGIMILTNFILILLSVIIILAGSHGAFNNGFTWILAITALFGIGLALARIKTDNKPLTVIGIIVLMGGSGYITLNRLQSPDIQFIFPVDNTTGGEQRPLSTNEGFIVEPEASSDKIKLTFLTQNTMFLPDIVNLFGKNRNERVPCVIDLIKNYDIVGLQEVFNQESQNNILESWHNSFPINTEPKPEWHPLSDADDVDNLVNDEPPKWNVSIIDARPNNIESELVSGPYYVMGPDQERLSIDNNGGLIILSKYPIIEASAFIYTKSTGFDSRVNKGALYARINVCPEREGEKCYIHVFNTHVQANKRNTEIRDEQFRELVEFIKKCTKDDNGKFDGFPIVFMGDLNVGADKTVDWMKENRGEAVESNEYHNMLKEFARFILKDVWMEIRPNESGFTWEGTDWEGGPWVDNVLAGDKGEPERLDYFFYYPGQKYIILEPQSINLVPSSPTITYCFDDKEQCHKTQPGDSCKGLKSHTISDHLGIEMECDVIVP